MKGTDLGGWDEIIYIYFKNRIIAFINGTLSGGKILFYIREPGDGKIHFGAINYAFLLSI